MGNKEKTQRKIIQMNAIETSSNKPLDYALIQCLRLFAQQGRKVRNHEMASKNYTPDDDATKDVSKNVRNKRAGKGQATHFRQLVE